MTGPWWEDKVILAKARTAFGDDIVGHFIALVHLMQKVASTPDEFVAKARAVFGPMVDELVQQMQSQAQEPIEHYAPFRPFPLFPEGSPLTWTLEVSKAPRGYEVNIQPRPYSSLEGGQGRRVQDVSLSMFGRSLERVVHRAAAQFADMLDAAEEAFEWEQIHAEDVRRGRKG